MEREDILRKRAADYIDPDRARTTHGGQDSRQEQLMAHERQQGARQATETSIDILSKGAKVAASPLMAKLQRLSEHQGRLTVEAAVTQQGMARQVAKLDREVHPRPWLAADPADPLAPGPC